jgi:hypothetical protein
LLAPKDHSCRPCGSADSWGQPRPVSSNSSESRIGGVTAKEARSLEPCFWDSDLISCAETSGHPSPLRTSPFPRTATAPFSEPTCAPDDATTPISVGVPVPLAGADIQTTDGTCSPRSAPGHSNPSALSPTMRPPAQSSIASRDSWSPAGVIAGDLTPPTTRLTTLTPAGAGLGWRFTNSAGAAIAAASTVVSVATADGACDVRRLGHPTPASSALLTTRPSSGQPSPRPVVVIPVRHLVRATGDSRPRSARARTHFRCATSDRHLQDAWAINDGPPGDLIQPSSA